jgi:signal transduction histidine kinase
MSLQPAARILIVDDEAPQMKALCDTLRDQGYETTGFAAGEEALAALVPGRFDLLLSDLMMPGMDGIALLRKAHEADPGLIAIIMTGQGTIATAVEAMKAGAFDYILKPFKLSVILPVLGRALAVRQLRLRNAELEQRVRERTAELEAANKELESFSYSVSHDLRAPLRHIDGFSQMILDRHGEQMPPDALRLLKQVTAGARRMGHLIDDLLAFSRLGRQPLTVRPVSVDAIVRETLEELSKEQAGRTVDVRIGPLPECAGDKGLLKQVYANLLGNAFKFTRKREVAVIEVGFAGDRLTGAYFVKDNGAGFNPRYVDRLFGVFQRLHSASEFEGTGVGLSIVQRIVQRHGGRIWAEGDVDKGAAFHFTLPGNATPAP